MNVLDTARQQAKHLVEKVTSSGDKWSGPQAITIGRPRETVIEFLQDADSLSQIFGDFATVTEVASDRLRWTFTNQDADEPFWESVVDADVDRLRYVDVKPDSRFEIVIDIQDALQDRGTELIARISSPAPGLLSGALAFKALYRARALLQTGEIPTITPNPSARNSAR
jgi:hypothetical protein